MPSYGSAATVHSQVLWDYDDYRSIPEDGQRYEIIEGELFVSPSPSLTHQTLSKRLQIWLIEQIEKRGLGTVFNAPADVIFSKLSVVQPDLIVIGTEQSNRIATRGIEGAPDLLIEIASPSTKSLDRHHKFKLYAQQRVREYWIVDAATETVEVFVLGKKGFDPGQVYEPGESVGSQAFSLDIAIDELFAPGFQVR